MNLPRIPKAFFKWYCRADRFEELHGDLEEFFLQRKEQHGERYARRKYWMDVIRCCQPFAWKKLKNSNSSTIMFRSNLRIAYRSMLRAKGYSTINIVGLAMGIAFSTMLFMYLYQELSFDRLHAKSDRIVRVNTVDSRVPDQVRTYGSTPPPVAPALLNDIPEVVNAVSFFQPYGQVVFKVNNVKYDERSWFATDEKFFEVFDFPFLHGDPKTCLSKPQAVVLTRSAAIKYFGQVDAVGKTLEQGDNPLEVTAVIEDLPFNSSLKFEILLSELTLGDDWKQYLQRWDRFGASTFLVLDNKTSLSKVESMLPQLTEGYIGEMSNAFAFNLQPLEDIYLYSDHVEYGAEAVHGRLTYLYVFGSMGAFILLIVAINYINLATSRAMHRAKEVGVRKSLGAYKKQLQGQFMTESILTGMASLVVSMLILKLVLPYFNEITNSEFALTMNTLQQFILPLLGITLLISVLSGAYPAFYLSRLRPASTLKGLDESGGKSSILRKTLVTIQFVLTIVMLTSTLIINDQLSYIKTTDIGFNNQNLLVIDINNRNVRQQFQAMKQQFETIPGVKSVGVSTRNPGEWKNIHDMYVKLSGRDDSLNTYYMGFDEGMLSTFDIALKEGAYFASNSSNDSTKILLNEAAVEALGLDNPIGTTLRYNTRDGQIETRVIGVVEDFHFQSLHSKIGPLVIGSWNNPRGMIDYFTLKIEGNPTSIIAAANEVHEQFDKNSPMEYNFLDERMNEYYEQEQTAEQIFSLSAALSIFVSALGLMGLASFIIQKRTKELSVRKILGASKSKLFLLLTSSFTSQIIIAFVIAAPTAYYLMKEWLTAFEYQVGIGPIPFIASAGIVLVMTLLTISYRALVAITANPVDTLRTE